MKNNRENEDFKKDHLVKSVLEKASKSTEDCASESPPFEWFQIAARIKSEKPVPSFWSEFISLKRVAAFSFVLLIFFASIEKTNVSIKIDDELSSFIIEDSYFDESLESEDFPLYSSL